MVVICPMIRIILLPGRALRHAILALEFQELIRIRIILLPGRALRLFSSLTPPLSQTLNPNHPPARKGITTRRRKPSALIQRGYPNHPPARKGITTYHSQSDRHHERGRDPNHPPARKGITTTRSNRPSCGPHDASESSSCPEGHYDPRSVTPICPTTSESSSCPEGHYDRKFCVAQCGAALYPNHPPARKGITTRFLLLCPCGRTCPSESSSCPEGHYGRALA